MSNNKETDTYDKYSIKVFNTYEVEYWAMKFGISPEELLSVVEKVGHSSIDVKQYLKSKA